MKPPRDGSALENIKQTLDSYLGRLTLTLLFGWGCVCHREEDEKRGDDGWELHYCKFESGLLDCKWRVIIF
jgi:hypothetical protein